MYCSGCGLALAPGQAVCPKCGRPAAMPVPPVPGPPMPGMEYLLHNYAGKVKMLGIFWLIYAGFSLLRGIIVVTFADALLSGRFGPWMHGPWPGNTLAPEFFGPWILHFALVFLLLRSVLALAAGWGLLEHAPWGRIVAIVAAIVNMIKLPFGTAIGIWTLVVLLGYRNSRLYDQL